MKKYRVVGAKGTGFEGKEKTVMAMYPASACRKFWRKKGWYWVDMTENPRYKGEKVCARVYLNDKLVAKCTIHDVG